MLKKGKVKRHWQRQRQQYQPPAVIRSNCTMAGRTNSNGNGYDNSNDSGTSSKKRSAREKSRISTADRVAIAMGAVLCLIGACLVRLLELFSLACLSGTRARGPCHKEQNGGPRIPNMVEAKNGCPNCETQEDRAEWRLKKKNRKGKLERHPESARLLESHGACPACGKG